MKLKITLNIIITMDYSIAIYCMASRLYKSSNDKSRKLLKLKYKLTQKKIEDPDLDISYYY